MNETVEEWTKRYLIRYDGIALPADKAYADYCVWFATESKKGKTAGKLIFPSTLKQLGFEKEKITVYVNTQYIG